jgi:hypothetical protein
MSRVVCCECQTLDVPRPAREQAMLTEVSALAE